MGLPTVFIGSSSEALDVAKAIGDALECCAEPTVWDEDVFEFGRGYLEELMCELEKHDFAVLVLSPDDKIETRGTTGVAPRDNVLFECGLFMGRLGRGRAFIVCDRKTKTKIPSDMAGVSLLTYDGERMNEAPASAVRGACMRINRAIKRPEFRQLSGDWKSRYLFPYNSKDPWIDEDVEVRPSRGKIAIQSKSNPKGNNYVVYGEIALGRHFIGQWSSMRSTATAGGAILLTIHPLGNIMYGIYTAPDDQHKITHGGWVLAKKGVPNEKVDELLEKATAILNETNFSLISVADHLKSKDQSNHREAKPRGNIIALDGSTERAEPNQTKVTNGTCEVTNGV
jgi:Predicted nucleotide-binding protein containing TIR-like domain